MPRPAASDLAPEQANYVALTQGHSIAELQHNHIAAIRDFYNALPEAKAGYAYAPGKWTVKDVLQHLIDAERIFTYRILCIGRGDTTSFPGFDENSYAAAATAFTAQRSLDSLKTEFNLVRQSTDLLLQNFTPANLQQVGTANNRPITPNTIAFIMYGHLLHHKRILEERYL